MFIVKHRKIFFIFSAVLVGSGILAVSIFGLRLGIDFLGGTLWQVKLTNNQQPTINNIQSTINNQQPTTYNQQPTTDQIRIFFVNDLKVENPTVYSEGDNKSFFIRLGHITEEDHQRYLSALKEKFGAVEEQRFDVIGPSVGKELETRAIWAIILVLAGISLYVTFAFRKVSHPIQSWKYGVITLITLFHDVAIPLGLFALLGRVLGIEVDINFVVAVLVVMGFSVHDTIVVFDRIRENLLINRQGLTREGLAELIGRSIDQTIARSVNTSLTLILVLLALVFLGPASLKYFVLTILVGVTVGTYSSIFIASPGLLFTSGLKK